MTHLSPRYRRRRTPQQHLEFRAAQERRIARRWEREVAERQGDETRRDRVAEVTIRDSHRPTTVVRIEARLTRSARGWGRRLVWENGKRVGKRRFGIRGVCQLLGKLIE